MTGAGWWRRGRLWALCWWQLRGQRLGTPLRGRYIGDSAASGLVEAGLQPRLDKFGGLSLQLAQLRSPDSLDCATFRDWLRGKCLLPLGDVAWRREGCSASPGGVSRSRVACVRQRLVVRTECDCYILSSNGKQKATKQSGYMFLFSKANL
ncbi:UNVERIFIED_CONTAM: hypothetical protein K2H54_038734 [Gekko kuhli]